MTSGMVAKRDRVDSRRPQIEAPAVGKMAGDP
jgi:hypothetical protein